MAADLGRPARLREVLVDGHNTLGRDRSAMEEFLRRWPWTGELVTQARDFHRQAARRAATAGEGRHPAAGVIFTACGYPPRGRTLHAGAAQASPGILAGYVDPDPVVNAVNEGVLALADPYKVAAWTADEADPEAVLRAPAAKEMLAAGPVQVHVVLAVQRWPGALAARVVGQYAKLLPRGSSLALSSPTAGPEWADYAEYLDVSTQVMGTQVYPHTPGETAGWFKAAGMRLVPPGVADAAEWGALAAVKDSGTPRIIAAAGIIP